MMPSLNKNKWNRWPFFCLVACIRLWILFTAGDIQAQELPIRFEQLSFENGLSQNRVQSIFQDSRGYHISKKNEYLFKMEESEDNWNYANERGLSPYSYFGTREYHFKVKGANSRVAWNDTGVNGNIRIVPLFWKTPLCSVLLVIGSISLLYVIHRYRLRLLRIRTQILKYEVNKRTNDLYTVNAHLINEIAERKKIEERLRVANQNLEAIVHASPLAIISLDREAKIVMWSPAAERIFQWQEKESIHHTDITIPEKYKSEFKDLFDAVLNGEVCIGVETQRLRKDGMLIDVSMSIAPLYDNENCVRGAICTVEDISERKRITNQIQASLKEKESLLREIHHRVKNNLQVISSLLRLQSQYVDDSNVVSVLMKCQNRIKSMALVHEKLYQESNFSIINFSDYIKNLIHTLYHTNKADQNQIALDLENCTTVFLPMDIAIPCGLVVNELVSNALSHAFPESWRKKRKIIISLSSNNGSVEINVCDNGIGLPEAVNLTDNHTLGLKLVNILVEDQMQGQLKLKRENGKGTHFHISFNRN